MFTQNWRQHWGLTEDPFACEDADKDPLLLAVDPAAVHSGFDRIFGHPKVPAPGIVFGEKGSGKSGLRRMMQRWIDDHNRREPDERIFWIEYIDFDAFIEQFQRAVGTRGTEDKAALKLLSRWEIADHLDCILSIGVTRFVDDLIENGAPKGLQPKQRIDLQFFTALYYNSPRRIITEALRKATSALRVGSARPFGLNLLRFLLTAIGIGIGVLPHLGVLEGIEPSPTWYGAGAGLIALTWIWTFLAWVLLTGRANAASKSVRVLQRDPAVLRDALRRLSPRVRDDYILPKGSDAGSRYDLLERFVGILRSSGYTGAYVLIDRIDEPSLLSGHDDRMRRFVEKLLDIKLLQFPHLALKLFLPIEMESIYRTASAEEMKRMRLDKSNCIPELKWTGNELYEIANQRLKASLEDGGRLRDISQLFEADFDLQHLRDTLGALGTPRYAFGFLSALFLDHVRELPNDLEGDDPRWGCSRAHFDVVRAAWLDRAGVLRRSLN